MPITVEQDMEVGIQVGRDGASRTTTWNIRETTDEVLAYRELLAQTPHQLFGLVRAAVTLKEHSLDSFTAVVTYGGIPIPTENEIRLTCSTMGGRERITVAKATFDTVAATGVTAPDTKGVIGLEPDGNINGVEIYVPQTRFSIEIHVQFDTIDEPFLRKFDALSYTVNKSRWKGFRPHELLFCGVEFDGTRRLNRDPDGPSLGRLRYDFAFSRDETRIPGNPNTGVLIEGLSQRLSKRGWDYADIRFEDFKDTASNTKVRIPLCAYARQVYDESNFIQLGLGS